MSKKTFYYSDEVHEDFAELNLNRPIIDENYKYLRKNKVNNFFSAILYYMIAKPFLSLVAIESGVRVKNKKNIKPFKNKKEYCINGNIIIGRVFIIFLTFGR